MAIDLHTKQHLAQLLEKPAMVTEADAMMLEEMVKIYPYYQPLHLLLAKANANEVEHNHFATAALYNGGSLLHRAIHQPENIVPQASNLVSNTAHVSSNYDVAENNSAVYEGTFITNEPADDQEVFEEISEINIASSNAEDGVPQETDSFVASIADEEKTFEEISEVSDTLITPTHQRKESETEEVYDEIAELDPSAFEIHVTDEVLPDEMAIENIVATDFFAFEKNFDNQVAAEDTHSIALVTQPEEYNQEAEEQVVSKYNDDKLPYTFLWWLAKTRKEHEQIFQPYVTPKKSDEKVGELQQQYVEHIFHLQTPFNMNEEAEKVSSSRQVAHRGDEIIDKFIKNEPQIKAPKAEQINNENKAKKSAEDHYDLVSETLAAIYIEQMLYHKAIDTYQKLSLKFPEKSRYFADLIQSLEKKI